MSSPPDGDAASNASASSITKSSSSSPNRLCGLMTIPKSAKLEKLILVTSRGLKPEVGVAGGTGRQTEWLLPGTKASLLVESKAGSNASGDGGTESLLKSMMVVM